MAQFIDKAAVVAEINRVLNSYDPNEITSGRYALCNLRDFLDTLDVKEVDINKEISQFIDDNFEKATIGHKLSLRCVAKHFFELGLNKDGYGQGYTDAIEKACEWLKENPPIRFDDIQNYVKNFYKAMEGGEQ